MDQITIYHNPRCSKSRQALALIQASGVEPEIIDYLTNPPDQKTLENILQMLRIRPRDLIRKSESEYGELNLDDPSIPDEQLVVLMTQHPRLIERPIVIKGNKAVVGRPPENVSSLLQPD